MQFEKVGKCVVWIQGSSITLELHRLKPWKVKTFKIIKIIMMNKLNFNFLLHSFSLDTKGLETPPKLKSNFKIKKKISSEILKNC
jgi:hypothetical protein